MSNGLPAGTAARSIVGCAQGHFRRSALAADAAGFGRTSSAGCTEAARTLIGLCDLEYPFHDRAITVTCCGRLCFDSRKINLSQVFAGQTVGIREVSEKIWLVSFMNYDLGFFDSESGRVECAPNPFDVKVSPMCPV
jgi:hypothetical protein